MGALMTKTISILLIIRKRCNFTGVTIQNRGEVLLPPLSRLPARSFLMYFMMATCLLFATTSTTFINSGIPVVIV